MAKSKAKKVQGKIYLIAPTDGGQAVQIQDDSFRTESRVGDVARAIFGGRQEIATEPDKIISQIQNYVTIINTVAEDQETKAATFGLSEITLSLTISVEGNIGIASTSAEAGLTLVFKKG